MIQSRRGMGRTGLSELGVPANRGGASEAGAGSAAGRGRRSGARREEALSVLVTQGVLLALLCLSLPPLVPAPAATPTDAFVTSCPQMADPPPAGFLPWSSLSTWSSLGFTAVPGIGAGAGANVTIPCGTAVLLDVPSVSLTVLQVQGFLKVNDPATPTTFSVNASLILVEGQLTVGSFNSHFRSKITFMLMPNPDGRQNWTGTSVLPAEPAFPRPLGHKAFVVMGGQVRMHGMPGGSATPSWVKLNVSARTNDFNIVVDTDVSQLWPVGSRIAIAATDYAAATNDAAFIRGYERHPQGTLITLDRALVFNHYGDPFGIPDGFGGFIDERAEVALLTRNIVITGLDETGLPLIYEGGHFMVYMTPVPQFLEGVEFWQLGTQTQLGRFSLHFNLCGNDRGRSVVRKNSFHSGKMRCISIKATHNLTIDSNVAYNTSGHCFALEDGGEMGNTFVNNLGIYSRGARAQIANVNDQWPYVFLISNMMNNYIGNVAAASDDSGFVTDLPGSVRSGSWGIPSISGIVPSATPFGTFLNNVAHSCQSTGFRLNSASPKVFWDVNQTTSPGWSWAATGGVIQGFTVWKQQNSGINVKGTNFVTLDNVTAADCNVGVALDQNYNGGLTNSRFVALSPNLGTPSTYWCPRLTDPNSQNNCAPTVGCNLTTNSTQWRARNNNNWRNNMFGVVLDAPNINSGVLWPKNLTNLRFHGYTPVCDRVSAGISVGHVGRNIWWNANQAVQGISSSDASAPSILIVAPRTLPQSPPAVDFSDFQPNAAIWDKDGSVVGGTGGFLITDPSSLPPARVSTCTARPLLNGLACPNTCYRSINFVYREDGYVPYVSGQALRARGLFSYMQLRRVEDGVTKTVDGNLNDGSNWGTYRSFWFSVAAPGVYEVSVGTPFSNSAFWPANLTVRYQDNGGCGAPVTLRFMSLPSRQWAVSAVNENTYWSPCPGASFTGSSTLYAVQYQYVCHMQRQVLQTTFLAHPDPNFAFMLVNTNQRVMPCILPQRCGIWTNADWYFYNAQGQELRPSTPGGMGYMVPGFNHASWPYGRGVIGNAGWNWDQFRTRTLLMNSTVGLTHYFRKNFTVANSACYSGIFLDIIPFQGLIAFLNNVEVFRWNLPAGNITNNTIASVNPPWPTFVFNTTFINITAANASFVEGTNWMAFEVHSIGSGNNPTYFDSRVSLLSNSGACTGASIMPEVCDGLDNNFDGLVDIDPVTGRLLTRNCSTPCGTGIETCISGAFQNCTAKPSLPEVCNGRDDNCDGLVDNGVSNTQLNCMAGNVCYQGQCLPQGPLTVPVTVIPRSTAGWNYLDKGWPWQTYTNWINGRFSANLADTTIRQFRAGVAPFGLPNTATQTGTINTTMSANNAGDIYYFFLRNFTLTAAEAANTWSLTLNVRREGGAVVWSNGLELMRSNFPATFNPPTDQFVFATQWGTCATCYWQNSPLRSTGVSGGRVKAGTNWVAAQVGNLQGQGGNAAFDLELVRNVNQSCSALPGAPSACVRNPPNDTVWFNLGANWAFLDLNYTLPPSSWIQPTFDDSAWPTGNAPLGAQSWTATRLSMNKTMRQAYYFRKTFTVADANCHYGVLFQLRALDGAVLYVNGVEAFRFQWQPQWVLPTDFANTYWPPTDKVNFTLSTGWLVNGPNTIAAEIHPSTQNTNNWYFDLGLSGQREGATCSPLPS